MSDTVAKKTKETAEKLFSGPYKLDVPYLLWKSFDKDLAKDLSLFITGQMYSRTVLPLPERQMVAVTALTALEKPDELELHLHGALNVGVDPAKIAEAMFQVAIYAGFPTANTALKTLKKVLQDRGAWPIQGSNKE